VSTGVQELHDAPDVFGGGVHAGGVTPVAGTVVGGGGIPEGLHRILNAVEHLCEYDSPTGPAPPVTITQPRSWTMRWATMRRA
jgi:hypothetical protein